MGVTVDQSKEVLDVSFVWVWVWVFKGAFMWCCSQANSEPWVGGEVSSKEDEEKWRK